MILTIPTLILNKDIVFKNINNIIKKTYSQNIIFRPHFKTHQSLEVGSWFKQLGFTKIAVSSVNMAQYFASSDWNDTGLLLLELSVIFSIFPSLINRSTFFCIERSLKESIEIFLIIIQIFYPV